MARININVGSSPNDGTGDTLRDAMVSINSNFTELYADDAADDLDAVTTLGNTTTNSITVGGLIVDTDTLYVDSTNNQVGIGTSSPNEGNLQVGDADTSTNIAIAGNRTKIGYDGSNTILFSAENIGMKFYTGHNTFANPTNERLRITSGGDISFFDTSANEALYWDASTAMLGIGVTSPLVKTQISTNLSSGSVQDALLLSQNTATSSSGQGVKMYLSSSNSIIRAAAIEAIAGSSNDHSLGFYTNSAFAPPAERMRIDSSGNVLINNTNTALYNATSGSGYLLEDGVMTIARETTASTQPLLVLNDTGVDGSVISFRRDGAEKVSFSTLSDSLAINTGGGEKMRIDSAGLVGIGTTSPTRELEVQGSGNVYIKVAASTDNDSSAIELENTQETWTIRNDDTNNDAFEIDSSTTGNIVTIEKSGNVGINETNPSTAKLVIQTDAISGIDLYRSSVNANFEAFRFRDSTNSNTEASIGWGGDQLRLNSTNNTVFTTGGTERMRIDSNGNVGIGTTSPSEKFEVTGNTILDASNANLKIKAGTTGTKGDIQWTFNTDSTVYASVGIEYDNRATDGLLIDSGYPITLDYAGQYIRFSRSGIEQMRIDSSGNVGIGTSSPNAALEVHNTLNIGDGTSVTSIGLQRNSANYITATDAAGYLVFRTGGATERMRITSGGRVLIGTTTEIGTVDEKLQVKNTNGGARGIAVGNSDGDSNTGAITFYNSNGIVGDILTNGSATSYNTSSDYRLKENVVEMTGALDRVDALKPSRFNFIADADKTVDGFLAHEVAEVIPEAVTGEKDAVDEEGNAIYQGIDQSKIVPLLVGAIQELKAEIEILKSQINP